jgi:hypothetical protein
MKESMMKSGKILGKIGSIAVVELELRLQH